MITIMHHSETYVIDIEVIASVLLILRSLLKSVIDVEVIVGECYRYRGHCRQALLMPRSLLVSLIDAEIIIDKCY